MKRKHTDGGYTTEAVWYNLDKNKPIYSLSAELTPVSEWKDGKPTKNIVGYKAGFTQDGAEYFQVKFPKEVTLPEYMAIVSFKNITAYETRYDVYFKADDLDEVK